MPVETRISPEFGRLVSDIIGADSFGQVSIRTGISQAYLLQMKRGKVPSEQIIEKFAAGYADRGADLRALRLAAGYEPPVPFVLPVEDVDAAIRRYRTEHPSLTDDQADELRRIVTDVLSHPSDE